VKRFLLAFLFLSGLWSAPEAKAFVLVGPMEASELGSGGIDFNYTDD
ncbi:uncharacterized protein METZ01_LOCUS329240, partial [marine metagenome]